jgi:hypothetical protein
MHRAELKTGTHNNWHMKRNELVEITGNRDL